MKKVVSILFIISAIYTGGWLFFAQKLKSEVSSQLEILDVKYDGLRLAGISFSPKLEVRNPQFQGVTCDGVISIASSIFRESISIESSSKITFSQGTLDGDFSLHIPSIKDISVATVGLFNSSLTATNVHFALKDNSFDMEQINIKLNEIKEFDRVGLTVSVEGLEFVKGFKNDFLLDSSIRIPDLTSFEASLPIYLNIKNYVVSNKFGNTSGKGLFELQRVGEDWKGHFSCECTNTIDKAQDSLTFKQLYKDMFLQGLMSDPKIQALAPDHLELVDALIPNREAMGVISFQFDGDFEGNESEWNVSLNNYSLSSDLYRFALDGKFNSSSDGFMNIQLTNYKSLVRDLSEYYNKSRSFLVALNLAFPQDLPVINEKAADRITLFLEDLSQSEKPLDFSVAINFKGPDQFVIGSKGMEQFLSSLGGLIQDISSTME